MLELVAVGLVIVLGIGVLRSVRRVKPKPPSWIIGSGATPFLPSRRMEGDLYEHRDRPYMPKRRSR